LLKSNEKIGFASVLWFVSELQGFFVFAKKSDFMLASGCFLCYKAFIDRV